MRELVVRDVGQGFDWLLGRRGGWLGVGRNMAVWFGRGLEVEGRAPITGTGQPAVSPDGALLALPGRDAVQVYRDYGDLEVSLALRPWSDRSTSAAAFSADGARLVVASAGPDHGTAEVAVYAAAVGWRPIDAVVIGTDVDVGIFVWPHPLERSFLIGFGAGQDAQWALCVREEADRLTATEIIALRDHGVWNLSRDGTAILSVPWGDERDVTWHTFPSGELLRSLPAPSLTGVDVENDEADMIHSIHGLSGWRTLIVTDGGRVRLLDCAPGRGRPTLVAETALDPGLWPVGVPGLADTRLLLGDSADRLHLLELERGV
jgi:hypothetical protein